VSVTKQNDITFFEFVMEANTAMTVLNELPWFNNLLKDGAWIETSFRMNKSKTEHYVMGKNSPFYFRMAISPKNKSILAAVWCGRYATNMGGSVQGGAISSIFDALTASVGSVQIEPGSFGTTKNLQVAFLAPTPLLSPLQFSVISATFNEANGTGIVKAQLTNGTTGKKYASCTAEMVDLKRRKKWKQQQKNKAKL